METYQSINNNSKTSLLNETTFLPDFYTLTS